MPYTNKCLIANWCEDRLTGQTSGDDRYEVKPGNNGNETTSQELGSWKAHEMKLQASQKLGGKWYDMAPTRPEHWSTSSQDSFRDPNTIATKEAVAVGVQIVEYRQTYTGPGFDLWRDK